MPERGGWWPEQCGFYVLLFLAVVVGLSAWGVVSLTSSSNQCQVAVQAAIHDWQSTGNAWFLSRETPPLSTGCAGVSGPTMAGYARADGLR